MARRAIFLAPLPAFRKRTRLAKMANVLCSRGAEATLFGWERVEGELSALRWPDDKVQEVAILRGGGYASHSARAMYPVWMWLVFCRVLRLKRGATVFCLGWETAFPAVLASYFSRAVIVFDDADRFSLLLKLPRPLHALLQGLERWASGAAAFHLVPGRTRYEWWHDRMRVLRNTPTSADFEAASALSVARPPAEIVLYVNGWISWDTGSSTYLETLKLLEERGVHVVMHVAGRVVSREGQELLQHPSVIFHGELPQVRALAIYGACDVALTFYDPAVEINHHAESNKWGDCVYFSVPFIVNEEVQTARHFVDEGGAWSVAYHDAPALADLLVSLAADKGRIRRARTALANLKANYRPYDLTFGEILDEVGIPAACGIEVR